MAGWEYSAFEYSKWRSVITLEYDCEVTVAIELKAYKELIDAIQTKAAIHVAKITDKKIDGVKSIKVKDDTQTRFYRQKILIDIDVIFCDNVDNSVKDDLIEKIVH
jgi:hypothetical protein